MRLTLSMVLRLGAVFAVLALAVFNSHVTASSPASSGIDLSTIDRTCKPCDDFYQFANGAWLARTKMPADKSYYGAFIILRDDNAEVLHQILDEVSTSNPPTGSNNQRIADYYNSCMDTAAIERAGLTSLAADVKAIDDLTALSELPQLVAELQLDNANVFFSFGREADFQNSTMNIAGIDQGGLGLPDREYYTKTDAKSVALRAQYQTHVKTMFSLIGENAATSASHAATVMYLETALAQNQLTNVQERDVRKTNNKLTLAALDKISPNFSWTAFFAAAGVAPTVANVTSPRYITWLSTQLAAWPLDQIKTYLRWQLMHAYATALPKAYEEADFAFYSTALEGTTAQLPRWKRCVRSVNANLGEALGQLYVAKAFPPEAKAAAVEMVQNIESAFKGDLATSGWMSPTTRDRAIEKLDALLVKIGYPTTWRNYSRLTIGGGPFATNLMAARRFETQRQLDGIGKPVDRLEWEMTPPTVNAYYNAAVNQIVFPAGILQPPFFYAQADPAVNYGGIGAMIGHESTHGFDDQGSLYDKNGNLDDWWTPADRVTFTARTQCIVAQFDALSPMPGVHENGKLVVGEETADLGGLTIAYQAFEKWQSTHPRRVIDGFTPEQRFFLGWAHVWMSMERPELIRLYAVTNGHAYDKFRVNATVSNMPAFAKAWMCKAGSAMVRPQSERCELW
jgi:putative endopeptidase